MPILVDTSVWIGHLRSASPSLSLLLEEDQVFCHPWVIGELALGSIKNRADILSQLEVLPKTDEVSSVQVRAFVERLGLFSRGIGWVDAQLLVSAATYPCRIWSMDTRLAGIAEELGIGWKPTVLN